VLYNFAIMNARLRTGPHLTGILILAGALALAAAQGTPPGLAALERLFIEIGRGSCRGRVYGRV
jgi:hypothetical protein